MKLPEDYLELAKKTQAAKNRYETYMAANHPSDIGEAVMLNVRINNYKSEYSMLYEELHTMAKSLIEKEAVVSA